MAFDRAKTLRAAEKFLELGKIPAAIKEYCKIVADNPDDFTTLNMLGDLQVRVGDKEVAISSFARVAEHFHKQDFALKAIAMYKKIDRLRPHDPEIAYTLAKLYAQQDLVVEARAHYLLVADSYTRANETQKALEILRQIANLDVQNTDIRIKLANAYLKEGMKQEALAAFDEAGERMLASGAFERALEVYQKSLEIDPVDPPALKGLLAVHSARGTADDAVEIIERASADDPDNTELLSMLADAYLESEKPAEAERAIDRLVAKDSFLYLRFVEVAQLYLKANQVEDVTRVIEAIADRMLAGNEDDQLLGLINELLNIDSDNVAALRLLVRIHWGRCERADLIKSLENLADAAQAAGLAVDERYALTQLMRFAPQDRYHERLNELGGPDEEAAAEHSPLFDDLAVTDAETIAFTSEEFASNAEAINTTGFELSRDEETVGEWTPAITGPDSEFEIGFESSGSEEPIMEPRSSNEMAAAPVVNQQAEARARELESVDFYIAQGYLDIAADTLNLVETEFGPHPDIDNRREQIKLGSEPADTVVKSVATIPAETSDPQEFEFSAQVEETPEVMFETSNSPNGLHRPAPATINAPPIDPGLAEIFEEFRLSEEAEATPNGDYETHYNLGIAYKEMDLLEEAVEEFQTAFGLVRPSDGTPRYLHCCNLLGHCFLQKKVPQLAVTWFERGLKTPGHSEEEYQALRFDLGLAYEEMGEIHRAVEIFTEIYGSDVSYRGVKEKLHQLQARA